MAEQLLLPFETEESLEDKMFRHRSEQTGISVEDLKSVEAHRQMIRESKPYKSSSFLDREPTEKPTRHCAGFPFNARFIKDMVYDELGELDIDKTLRKSFPSDFSD